MDAFSMQLNDLLVDTFRVILKIEESSVKNLGCNLSIGEMHLIETIGKLQATGSTIRDIAREQMIAGSSVTVAINKLEKKGFVERQRSSADARSVNVTLTRLGEKMSSVHRYFHARMVSAVSDDFTGAEKEVLLAGIVKLNNYFRRSLELQEGQ